MHTHRWQILSSSWVSSTLRRPPGVLGSWGEELLIFRELESAGNYFRGALGSSGEQAHTFEHCQKAEEIKQGFGKITALFLGISVDKNLLISRKDK